MAGMGRVFIADERGAAASDWVVLSAAILLLGLVVSYTVMHDSAGYLMSEFDEMNHEYSTESSAVVALSGSESDSATYSSSQ